MIAIGSRRPESFTQPGHAVPSRRREAAAPGGPRWPKSQPNPRREPAAKCGRLPPVLTDTIPCRLCDGSAEYVFTLPILGRIQAGYYRCRECGSLLTETPSWLEQAYGYPGTTVDVGSALRPLQNWLFLAATFDRLGLPRSARYIDVGANTGLLTRLMRYSGFDFVSYEKYVVPYYSDYDVIASLKDERCFGVTAFEVLEHFVVHKSLATFTGRTSATRPASCSSCTPTRPRG